MIKPEIQERYLRDDLPIRLGGLAADLARIVSFSDDPKSAPVVASLLEESRWFIEWSVPDLLPARVDDAARLVDVGRKLTYWVHAWHHIHTSATERQELSNQAQAWSDEVLAMSGLLEQE